MGLFVPSPPWKDLQALQSTDLQVRSSKNPPSPPSLIFPLGDKEVPPKATSHILREGVGIVVGVNDTQIDSIQYLNFAKK